MTKLAIAGLALGLAGAGALAAVGIKRLSCGECPLSGAPIAAHASPTPVASQTPVAAQDGAPAAHATMATETGAATCPAASATQSAESECGDCPSAQQKECATECDSETPQTECSEKRCDGEKKPAVENP